MVDYAKQPALAMFGALGLSLCGSASAQPYICPDKGQIPQQQEFDKG